VKRPISIYLGFLLLIFRVISYLVTAVSVAVNWHDLDFELTDATKADAPELTPELVSLIGLWFVLGVIAISVLIDGVIAILVYRGSNAARYWAMTVSAFIIVATALTYFSGATPVTLENGGLVGLSLDVLILIALSSTEARQFALSRRKKGLLK
jgi:hypothetical protein